MTMRKPLKRGQSKKNDGEGIQAPGNVPGLGESKYWNENVWNTESFKIRAAEVKDSS